MKRYAVIMLIFLFLSAQAGVVQAEDTNARVVVDGIELTTDVPPMLINDRTMVPFRAIAEAMGVEVTWVGETRTILANGEGTSLELVLGQTTAVVNGVPHTLDVPPQLVQDRTMVPARIFAESFGATVTWDSASATAHVWSAVRPMQTLAFYGLGSYEWRYYIRRFSDVAFTWSMVDAEGQLALDDLPYNWPQGAEEVLDLAKDSRTDRYLTVLAGDQDGRVTDLVLDPKARGRLADQIEATLTQQQLEGVVLDLEGLGHGMEGNELAEVRAGYVALVRLVAERLHPLRKQVIAAVHPPNGWYPGYDYAAIAAVADRVLVMAHDYNASGSEEPEPLAQVETAIRLSIAQMPQEKILLGILMEHENRESVIQKVALAKRHHLAGISIWIMRSLDQEEMEAIETLVSPAR